MYHQFRPGAETRATPASSAILLATGRSWSRRPAPAGNSSQTAMVDTAQV